jgi:uncharacterized membrane protein
MMVAASGWAMLAAAIGCGLVAGIFYAFSTFIMRALGKIPPAQGIRAMQSINLVIINPWFLGLFFGTALLCLGLAVLAGTHLGPGWAGPVLAGSLLYLVGTIGVTMALNVPLNNRLAVADAESAEGRALWAHYLRVWTFWNTVRTLAALAATLLLALGWRSLVV